MLTYLIGFAIFFIGIGCGIGIGLNLRDRASASPLPKAWTRSIAKTNKSRDRLGLSDRLQGVPMGKVGR